MTVKLINLNIRTNSCNLISEKNTMTNEPLGLKNQYTLYGTTFFSLSCQRKCIVQR